MTFIIINLTFYALESHILGPFRRARKNLSNWTGMYDILTTWLTARIIEAYTDIWIVWYIPAGIKRCLRLILGRDVEQPISNVDTTLLISTLGKHPILNVVSKSNFNVETKFDFNVETTSDFIVETTWDFNVEITSYSNVETTSDFNVETTSYFNVATTSYFNVVSTSYFNVDSF